MRSRSIGGGFIYVSACHRERWTCVPCGDKMALMLCSLASAWRNLPIVSFSILQPVFERGLAYLCRVFSRVVLTAAKMFGSAQRLKSEAFFAAWLIAYTKKGSWCVTTNLCFFLVGHQGLEPRTN